jgi:hypothetical protein
MTANGALQGKIRLPSRFSEDPPRRLREMAH